jgi:hypothetical protein
VGVAAAIVVVVGLAAILTLSHRDRSPTTGSPDATASVPATLGTSPPLLYPLIPPVVYLPTVALPGFSLADISVVEEASEPSTAGTSPTGIAAITTLHFVADDPRPGAFVDVTAFVNDNPTVDSIEAAFKQAGQATDRAVVHGVPAIVATSAAGMFGPLISVSWLEKGDQVSISGRTGRDDLVAFADGLVASSLAQARQVRASLDVTRLALPEVDRATLPNGFDISIRTNGTGANVICLQAPIQRCQLFVTENSLEGDFQREIVGTFWINGTPWFTGWAEGSHSPHLFVSGEAGDPLVNFAQTKTGTFFAAELTDTDTQVVFDPTDPTSIYGPGSGTNADLLI